MTQNGFRGLGKNLFFPFFCHVAILFYNKKKFKLKMGSVKLKMGVLTALRVGKRVDRKD